MFKRQTFCKIVHALNKKFKDQFGFPIKDVTYSKVVEYLHTPKDPSSLAVTRILFGVCMLFDIPDERGGAHMDRRWDAKICHFPLFPFIRALAMPYMTLIYAGLCFGALGITLGYKYRLTSVLFTLCYWYLFLIEKSYWNNHSYLFGLVAFLLSFTDANCLWSLDAYLNPSLSKTTVPYWNYFILKYQFFILYFMAGMKKGTAEWLTGYAMQRLSEHWVFAPFRLFLTVPQIDYMIVHCFIFVFDLTIALWMMWSRTRHVAMVFCALFHLMNSRLFRIGMFPWVCLAAQPLFYPFNWPRLILDYLKDIILKLCNQVVNLYLNNKKSVYCQSIQKPLKNRNEENEVSDEMEETVAEKDYSKLENETTDQNNTVNDETDTNNEQKYDTDQILKENDEKYKEQNTNNVNDKLEMIHEKPVENVKEKGRKNITICLIFAYVFIQAFLPYSHFITKGYNNWTNGLYGYSWDMMVHSWDTHSVVVKIVDNTNQKDFYLDPDAYTPNDRWTRHGDMLYQYAHCLKDKLIETKPDQISKNISIYFDIWYSLNGRFIQRVFESEVDMLKVSWSPFEEVSYLMPLLDEALEWRELMDEIRTEVQAWSNRSEVIFLADFPGHYYQKFIPKDLTNITLTVLQGPIVFESEVTPLQTGLSYPLTSGNRIKVDSGSFHRVLNIGKKPAYYMYTFTNDTNIEVEQGKPKLPIIRELGTRFSNMLKFGNIIFNSVFEMCFWKSQCK